MVQLFFRRERGFGRGRVALLSSDQKKLLDQALRSAFPTYGDLELLFAYELDDRNLADISAPDAMPQVVYRVIRRSEAEGWTAKLVTAAAVRNPGNPRLQQLVADGFLDADVAVRRIVDDPGDGAARDLLPQAGLLAELPRQELQRVVNAAAGFHDVIPFATALLEQASRVCRVEVVGGAESTTGTGFLVGPDLVLTNHHVLADVVAGTTSSTGVRCRFDFHVRADQTIDHGNDVPLAADWRVADSPHSVVDTEPLAATLPSPDELDYALIRLEHDIGARPAPGRDQRGWLDLFAEAVPLTPGTPLLILQHPASQPLKYALDTAGVLAVNGNCTRVTYGVNTLKGSSGSPCFSLDLRLVALHHAGAPEFRVDRNEGVPIAAIAAHLPADIHAATRV